MSYEATEQSKHGGRPIELYRFVGTYQNFYYTSGQRLVEFQAPDEDASNVYTPLAIKRSAISSTTHTDTDAAEVTIDLPVSTDIVAIYGFQIAPPELVLTIFRGHSLDEMVQYWKGDVENIQVVKGTATIRVPSKLAAALSADLPNVYFQTPCNHNLYDARCGIDFEEWSQTVEITDVDGKTITVDAINEDLDGNLVGGDAILTSGERRMIVAQTDNVISVNYPFAGAEAGSSLVIAAGCDLSWAGDCLNRFDNTERFGGFPFIPPKNIFTSGVEPGKDVSDIACLPDPSSNPTFSGWHYRVIARHGPPGTAITNGLGFWNVALNGVGPNATPPDLAPNEIGWQWDNPDIAAFASSGLAVTFMEQHGVDWVGANPAEHEITFYLQHWSGDSAPAPLDPTYGSYEEFLTHSPPLIIPPYVHIYAGIFPCYWRIFT